MIECDEIRSYDYIDRYSYPSYRKLNIDSRNEFVLRDQNRLFGTDLERLSRDSKSAAFLLKRRLESKILLTGLRKFCILL